jgi:hypothetical protein
MNLCLHNCKHVITFSNVSLIRMTEFLSVVSSKVSNRETNSMILVITIMLACICLNFVLVSFVSCSLEFCEVVGVVYYQKCTQSVMFTMV